jgi:hypothetical protein
MLTGVPLGSILQRSSREGVVDSTTSGEGAAAMALASALLQHSALPACEADLCPAMHGNSASASKTTGLVCAAFSLQQLRMHSATRSLLAAQAYVTLALMPGLGA